jgi:hypothetical protein
MQEKQFIIKCLENGKYDNVHAIAGKSIFTRGEATEQLKNLTEDRRPVLVEIHDRHLCPHNVPLSECCNQCLLKS